MIRLTNVVGWLMRFVSFVINLFGKIGLPVAAGCWKSHEQAPGGTFMHTSSFKVIFSHSGRSRKRGVPSQTVLSLTFGSCVASVMQSGTCANTLLNPMSPHVIVPKWPELSPDIVSSSPSAAGQPSP
jgi:hypothetical protein